MNRDSMVRQTKLEMKRWIDQIDLENAEEVKDKLIHYFKVIDTLKDLPEAPPVPIKKKEAKVKVQTIEEVKVEEIVEDTKEIEEIPVSEENESMVEIEEEEIKEVEEIQETALHTDNHEEQVEKKPEGYIFERKLRGGTINEISAFIPEGIVRKLNLDHGDRIDARKMEDQSEDGRNRFHYTLLEKGDMKEAPDRKQLDYCIVEKEAGTLIVNKSSLTGESVRFNGVSYSIVLNEQDTRNFLLREGDIVDIAFKKNKPSEHKVLWKHEDIDLPGGKTLNSPVKRKKENDPVGELVEFPDQTLKGISVMVVGNQSSRTSYQEQIEKRGGEFLWIDAKEKVDRFEPMVKKASFVIFLLGLSGHTGMKKIKQLCKEYKIPFEGTFNQGITSITRLAEEVAEKLPKQKRESISALS